MKKSVIVIMVVIAISFALTMSVKAQSTGEAEYQAKKSYARMQEEMKEQEIKRQELEKKIQFMATEIEEKYPQFYKILEEYKVVNRSHYRNVQRQLAEKLYQLRLMEKENPKMVEMEFKIQEMQLRTEMLSEKYLKASEKIDKTGIEKELRKSLENLFEAKIDKRKYDLVRLEKELDALRRELQVTQKNKKEAIELKLKQLTQTDVFEW